MTNSLHQYDILSKRLFVAVYGDRIDDVRCLLQKHSRADIDEVINRNDHSHELQHTVLTICCFYNYLEVLEVLLSRSRYGGRADPDVTIAGGRTPLSLASSMGYCKCMQLLIDHKAALDVKNTISGRSSLITATDNGHAQAVELLLKSGADISTRDNDGDTALGKASIHGLEKIMLKLLHFKADPEMLNCQGVEGFGSVGVSALYLAAQYGRTGCVQILISAGADLAKAINISDGSSALCRASAEGHTEVLKLLMRHGADVDHRNKRGQTPLHHAVLAGHISCVRVLLSHNASLKSSDAAESPLEVAEAKRYVEIFQVIKSHQVRLKSDDIYKMKLACVSGDIAALTKIAEKVKNNATADFNFDHINEDFNWMSSLMLAAAYDAPDCIRFLASNGCDIDLSATDDKSRCRSAIMYAAESGALASMIALIEAGADVGRRSTPFGETPLSIASGNGQAAVMRYLLTLPGIDVTSRLNVGLSDLSMINGATALSLYLGSKTHLDEELFMALLELDLPCSHSGVARCAHGDSLALALDCSTDRLTEDCRLRAVRTLFERHPLIHRQLATAVDRNDRSVMNITHKSVKEYMEDAIYFCGRYELNPSPPVHRSATALVMCATDHLAEEYYRTAFRTFLLAEETRVMSRLQFFVCLRSVEKLGLSDSLCLNPETPEGWDRLCDHFAACGEGKEFVSEDEFVAYSCAIFGKTADVTIKFMLNKDQHDRERRMRGEGSDYKLSPQYVVNLLAGPSPDRFRIDVSKSHFHSHPLGDYKYGLIMPAADKSLDCIFRTEFTDDILRIMMMMKDVARALKSVHDMGVMHGDIKMLNILRFKSQIKLIDLDAACDMERGDFAGVKFSSGLLPPEMFYQLKSQFEIDQFESYWSNEKNAYERETAGEIPSDCEERARQKSLSNLWLKIRPRDVTARGGRTVSIVVKTLRGQESTQGLPYSSQLIRASPLIDIWAFGAVLYSMCSGAPLVLCKVDDDILQDEDYLSLYSLVSRGADSPADRIQRSISRNVSNALAQNLLNLVLNPDPSLRLGSMAEVLDHPFFCIT